MNVYVVTETTPDPHSGEDTIILGVYRNRFDAMARVREAFDEQVLVRGWNPGLLDEQHPESFIDAHGGVIGDLAELTGWVYWNIVPSVVQ